MADNEQKSSDESTPLEIYTGVHEKKVVIGFNQPISGVTLTPSYAIELAKKLRKAAKKAVK